MMKTLLLPTWDRSLKLCMLCFGFLVCFTLGCSSGKSEARKSEASNRTAKTVEDSGTATPGEDIKPRSIPQSSDPEVPEEEPDGIAYQMQSVDEHDYHVVEVFYATDRQPSNAEDLSGFSGFTAVYGWPIIAGLSTLVFLVLTFRTERPARYCILTLIMAGICLKTTQSAMLRMQRHERAVSNEDRQYGANRHEVSGAPILEWGICEVSVPPDHRVGKVESPSVLKLEFREDPEKHVVIHRTILLPDDEFIAELQKCIRDSDAKQALVFIHGYNVSFDDAVKRTAQIAYDLHFDGAPICYSWPSQGGLEKYTYDEESIRWTVPQLETFFNRIVEKSGANTIHLVAHSMGNRALVEVLERIYLQNKDGHYKFGQIIMAAPDVDASSFRNRYAAVLKEMSARTTLYASSNDRALLASTEIHGYSRAGLSGEHLLALADVETVDASPIDTSLIGHSYYGNNPIMIRDLQAVIQNGIPANARSWLQEMLQQTDLLYWRFRDQLPELDGAGNAPEL